MSEARAIAPRVTVLPATRNRFTTAPIASVQKRRVAAYARVSTDSDEQLTSYEAQVDYYTHYIKERPDWTFAGMYADEGISGTNTKRREGFNQMITDALAGKIDLIVTKSVSRFARNTVDIVTSNGEQHFELCGFEPRKIYEIEGNWLTMPATSSQTTVLASPHSMSLIA